MTNNDILDTIFHLLKDFKQPGCFLCIADGGDGEIHAIIQGRRTRLTDTGREVMKKSVIVSNLMKEMVEEVSETSMNRNVTIDDKSYE